MTPIGASHRLGAADLGEAGALLDDREHLIEEPRVDRGDLGNALDRDTTPQRGLHQEQPVRGRHRGGVHQLLGRHRIELGVGRIAREPAAARLQ